jgi:hypothetical protein
MFLLAAVLAGPAAGACGPRAGAAAGSRACTANPPPGRGPASGVPPRAAARCRIPASPAPVPSPKAAGAAPALPFRAGQLTGVSAPSKTV